MCGGGGDTLCHSEEASPTATKTWSGGACHCFVIMHLARQPVAWWVTSQGTVWIATVSVAIKPPPLLYYSPQFSLLQEHWGWGARQRGACRKDWRLPLFVVE